MTLTLANPNPDPDPGPSPNPNRTRGLWQRHGVEAWVVAGHSLGAGSLGAAGYAARRATRQAT